MGDALALEAVGVEPEEEKEKSIPLVAASETGIAQTEKVSFSGL